MAQEHPSEPQLVNQVEDSVDEVIRVRAEDVIKPLEAEQYEFDFWEDLKDSFPPWIDEVVGFALFVFGISVLHIPLFSIRCVGCR